MFRCSVVSETQCGDCLNIYRTSLPPAYVLLIHVDKAECYQLILVVHCYQFYLNTIVCDWLGVIPPMWSSG